MATIEGVSISSEGEIKLLFDKGKFEGENVIEFPFDDSGGTELIEIRIGKYSLPVYIISNKSSSIIKFVSIVVIVVSALFLGSCPK